MLSAYWRTRAAACSFSALLGEGGGDGGPPGRELEVLVEVLVDRAAGGGPNPATAGGAVPVPKPGTKEGDVGPLAPGEGRPPGPPPGGPPGRCCMLRSIASRSEETWIGWEGLSPIRCTIPSYICRRPGSISLGEMTPSPFVSNRARNAWNLSARAAESSEEPPGPPPKGPPPGGPPPKRPPGGIIPPPGGPPGRENDPRSGGPRSRRPRPSPPPWSSRSGRFPSPRGGCPWTSLTTSKTAKPTKRDKAVLISLSPNFSGIPLRALAAAALVSHSAHRQPTNETILAPQ